MTITLLAGMPVQSSAPVQKRFFDEFAGDFVILETAYRGDELSVDEVQEAASTAGLSLTDAAADYWAWRISTLRLRENLVQRGTYPEPPLEELPPFVAPLVADLRQRPPRRESEDGRWDNPAMFRGHETIDRWGFWQVFFYRFVDPASRMGDNLNYAQRIQGARAVVLESTWVVFHTGRSRAPTTLPEQ